jgi:hypothetical protein
MKIPIDALRVALSLLFVSTASAETVAAVATPDHHRLEHAFRMGMTGYGDPGEIVLDRDRSGEGPFGLRIRWRDNPATDRSHYWHLAFPVRLDGAERVSGKVMPLSRDKGGCHLYFTDERGARWLLPLSFSELPLDQWTRFDIAVENWRPWSANQGRVQAASMTTFVMEPHGENGAVDFVLADLTARGAEVQRSLLDAREFPKPHVIPSDAPRVPPLDIDETGRAFVAGNVNYFYVSERTGPVVEDLAARWPLSGISASIGPRGHAALVSLSERCRAAGVPLMAENAVNAGFNVELSMADAWATRWDGAGNNVTPGAFMWQHTGDICHPRFIELVKQRSEFLASAGVTRMVFVDYVWPYWGGRWGYGPAAVAAYRAALQERDGGILLRRADGERRFSFWDYFRLYGDGPWTPDRVGLATWDEYEPVTEQQAWTAGQNARRNMFLLVTLQHYLWLRFLDDIGGHYASLGGKLWVIPNPEDLGNASDYVVLGAMAHVRGKMGEWFGNPNWTDPLYRSGPYLSSVYRDAGNLLGPVHESGAGGHARPYYDPEVAFAAAYDVYAAIRAEVMKNDFLDGAPLDRMRDPANEWAYDRYRDTMMKLDAFHRFRADDPRRAPSRVAVVCQRNVNRYSHSIFFSFGEHPRRRHAHLAATLAREGAMFDYLDPMPFAPLEDHDVIFWDAEEAPEHQFQRIAAWLRDAPGRTLVCMGNQPARRVDGLLYNPWGQRQHEAPHPDGGAPWGLPRITRRDLASLSAGAPHAWFAAHFSTNEQITLPPTGYYDGPGGAPLLGDPETPLVSRFDLTNGSQVIYLHIRAGGNRRPDQPGTEELDRRLVRGLIAGLDLPTVVPAPDADTMAHRYELESDGAVFALWHRPSLDAWDFIYDGNRKQRLAYRADGARLRLNLVLDKPATLIDVISGQRLEADAGPVAFEVADRTCALVYQIPAGQPVPQTLAEAPPTAPSAMP